MTFEEAMDIVHRLAYAAATTEEEYEAVNQLQDFIVNELGED